VIDHQVQLWRETTAEDPAEELEVLRGGENATKVDPKMYHDIQVILSRLVTKAEQLVDNVTTNLAESWMHLRSKFDGGKVVNRSQSGSWEHRCMGAGLQHNEGKEWGPSVWKVMTSSSPSKAFKDSAKKSCVKAISEKNRKSKDSVKQLRRQKKISQKNESAKGRKAYSRHDDGFSPDSVDDVSPDHLETLKRGFYEANVVVTSETIHYIQQQTKDQSGSNTWISERRKRLTASTAGSIVKMRTTTKKGKKVENLLYNKFKGNVATHYGHVLEERAKADYQSYQQQHGHPGLKVDCCGLFVSFDNPWLAATPDGLVTPLTHWGYWK